MRPAFEAGEITSGFCKHLAGNARMVGLTRMRGNRKRYFFIRKMQTVGNAAFKQGKA